MDDRRRRRALTATPARARTVAILANVVGGTSYALTKVALEGLTETTLVVVRTIVALAVLVPLAGSRLGRLLRVGGDDRRLLLAMGVAGYALPLVLASYGMRRSTATNAALLIGVEPIGVVLLAALVLGERIGRLRALALALGIAGATVLVADGVPFVTTAWAPHPAGDALLVLAALAWAPYSVAGRRLAARHDAIALSAGSLLVALPCLVAIAGLEMRTSGPRPDRLAPALAAAAVLGVVVSAGMTVLWNTALEGMDASRLAGFIALQPLTGVLLGAVALGEPLDRWTALGGALVLAGVAALVVEERRQPPRPVHGRA